MTSFHELDLAKRLALLECRLKTTRLAGIALVVPLVLVAARSQSAERASSAPSTVTARRFVVVDDWGRDRIVLGVSPLAGSAAAGRSFAIELKEEDGTSRLVLGEHAAFVAGGKVRPRERACGIVLNDPDGNERGGFSVYDHGKVLIGLDRKAPDSDGVALMVDDAIDFVGLAANHKQIEGQYVEGLAIGVQRGQSIVALKDTRGRNRVWLSVKGTDGARCQLLDEKGAMTADAFAK